jgi:two-component system, NarL family, nitrate/nitrite response regulator NarL
MQRLPPARRGPRHDLHDLAPRMVPVPQAPVRVLIASRSPAWSAGIASFLSVPPLVPECAYTVGGALARLEAGPVAAVVVDHALADAPGAELAAEVRRRHPGARLVLVPPDDGADARLAAAAAGASGHLLPTWTRNAVVDAVEDALRGVVAPAAPADAAARRRRGGPEALTEQERVVLRLMRQRLTYKEIALRLGLSWHTVRTHAQSVLRKSGVHSRRDLDAWDARLSDGVGAPDPAGRA